MTYIPVKAVCTNDLKHYKLIYKHFKFHTRNHRHHGKAIVRCKKPGMVKFNCYQDYCSEVQCYDPVKFCKKRYAKINLKKNERHCDKSCMSNGRCQIGTINNTPDSQLLKIK